MEHLGLKVSKVNIHDNPILTLTYFYGKFKFGRLCVHIGKNCQKVITGLLGRLKENCKTDQTLMFI